MSKVFKVLFQEDKLEVPVRERTQTLYVKAESERDVRLMLKDRPYNIELIQLVDGDFLTYEEQNENFQVLEL